MYTCQKKILFFFKKGNKIDEENGEPSNVRK